MKTDSVLCLSRGGFHEMRYVEWGDPQAAHIAICAHGLTRNGRDFDFLAQALPSELRVVCPDVVGRGASDWLSAKEDYGYAQYCADMTVLIARLTAGGGHRRIYWVGTSMGGVIGILLAARPATPIAKLVVNDIGPAVPQAALERIGSYLGKDPRFDSFEALEAYVRAISAPFGALRPEHWRHLALHSARRREDGSWSLRYDPGIAVSFLREARAAVDLWRYWDAIACPTLLLRGALSDVLPREQALEMTRRGPRPRLVEFEGIGHAPMLMDAEQIAVVRDFLLAPGDAR